MRGHRDGMQELLETCVKLTRAPGTHHRSDIEKLINAILVGHEETIKSAAKNGQTCAYIFVYSLGTKYEGASIYDYLFPNAQMLPKLKELHLDPVMLQIEKFFEPFEVSHKIYQISGNGIYGVTFPEVTLKDDDIRLFQDGKLADAKYVGAIIVNWTKYV